MTGECFRTGLKRHCGKMCWFLLTCSSLQAAATPDLDWARALGGTGAERGLDVAQDRARNVYIVGSFEGTVDFDPGPESSERTSKGDTDIFLTKFNRHGDFIWVRTMGGTGEDRGNGIIIDDGDHVYLTGQFMASVDFDPGDAELVLASARSVDAFVSKLDRNGNLGWAYALGGNGNDSGMDLALDSAGNLYTLGSFYSSIDLDPRPGTEILSSSAFGDVFLLKLTPEGTYIWGRTIWGSSVEHGEGVAVDSQDNVIVTGTFYGTTVLNFAAGNHSLTSLGGSDIFYVKLDANANFQWARSIGHTSSSFATAIATDALGNIYATGYFEGGLDFDPGPGTHLIDAVGSPDAFLLKLDASGDFTWVHTIGSTGTEIGYDVQVDDAGGVYSTGSFSNTVVFNPGETEDELISLGGYDAYVVKYDVDGNFAWATSAGGMGRDEGIGISIDEDGAVSATGYFNEVTTFSAGKINETLTSAGSDDAFLSRIIGNPDVIAPNAIFVTPLNQSPTNADSIEFLVEFDDDIELFDDEADLIVEHSGTSHGGVSIAGSGSIHVVTLAGVEGDGTITLTLNTQSDVQDLAGNGLLTSATSVPVLIDNTPPNAIAITPSTVGPLNGNGLDFDVSFDEAVVGFDAMADLLIEHSGTTGSGASMLGGGDTYTVFLDGLRGEGSFSMTLNPGSDVTDLAGNTLFSSVTSDRVTLYTESPASGAFEWAITVGSATLDEGVAIATDWSGNVYATGTYNNNATVMHNGESQVLTSSGNKDIYVLKTDANGTIDWLGVMGGPNADWSVDLAVDFEGNVFITGLFRETADLDPGPEVLPFTAIGNFEVFLTKLSPDGELLWTRTFGGTSECDPYGLATDYQGNVYVTGNFLNAVDFDPGVGEFILTGTQDADIFVSKLDPEGNLLWARSAGGYAKLIPNSIAVEAFGSLYVTGRLAGGDIDFDPGPGVFTVASKEGYNSFVWKLDQHGWFSWVRTIYEYGHVEGKDICLDARGKVYVTGCFDGSADFDPGEGRFSIGTRGGNDAYAVVLDPNGEFEWARSIGGTSGNYGSAVAVAPQGEVFVAGSFYGTCDFLYGPGSYNLTALGSSEAYAAKFTHDGTLVWAKALEGLGSSSFSSIAVDGLGNLYATGGFAGDIDFDPGIGTAGATAVGLRDSLIVKLSAAANATAPRVLSITPSTAGPTNASSLYFVAVFDEPVQNFDSAEDLEILISGSVAADFSVAGGGNTYLISMNNITGMGSVAASVSTTSGIEDLAGNALAVSLTSPPVIIDTIAPSAVSITAEDAPPGDMSNRSFMVQFSEAVTEFNDATDVEVLHSGTQHSTVSIEGGPSEYILTIGLISGVGSFSIAVSTMSDVRDVAGNALAYSEVSPTIFVEEREGNADVEGEGSPEGGVEGSNEGNAEGSLEAESTDGEADGEGIVEAEEPTQRFSADSNGNGFIELTELLRVIQLYNSGSYFCDMSPSSEDGYGVIISGVNFGDPGCSPHTSDYLAPMGEIGLSELLRLIQFFNLEGVQACPEAQTEDGFCAPV